MTNNPHALMIRNQASRWLIELQTAPDLNAIWQEFETWLDQDPEHKRVYEVMEGAWKEAGDVIRNASPAQIDAYFKQLHNQLRLRRWVRRLALFLCLLAVAVTVIVWR